MTHKTILSRDIIGGVLATPINMLRRVQAKMIHPIGRATFLAIAIFGGALIHSKAFSDEAALKQLMTAYTEAFNKHDASAVANLWTDNCVHVDRELGERTEGKAAIAEDLKALFAAVPSVQFSSSISSVRMIQTTVASVEGETMVSGLSSQPQMSDFTAIVVLQNGKWLLDSVDESPKVMPTTANEALQSLAWLVGDWQDDSDVAMVQTSCRWSANETFLLRSYNVQIGDEIASSGTQVIGWDANENIIRSWNFDSSGGFGEARWTQSGDEWLVRGSQTSAEGVQSAGTYIFNRIGPDEISVQLIGREVEGSMMPNEAPIRVLRITSDESATEEESQEAGAAQ